MHIFFIRAIPSLDRATYIASLGFCQPVSSALRDDVDNHLAHGQLTYSIVDRETLATIGFALFNLLDDSVLYLSGIILNPEYQGQGIARLAVEHAAREANSKYLALRTQSPRMWSGGEKMTTSWFPHHTIEDTPFLRELGVRAATATGSTFPVKAGFYGGPLYGAKQTHHDAHLQAWWDSLCNFQRVDAVFCIGKLQTSME
jgi:GNAT superfamily N-acetyltransferase